jgi:hypothetical protein
VERRRNAIREPESTWSPRMHLSRRISLVLAVIALLGSNGCASNIGTTHDPFVIFPETAQWAWDEKMNTLPSDPSMQALNIRTIVRESVTEALATKGYTLEPAGGKVDFRVHYQVGITKVITENSPKAYGSLNLTLVNVTTNRTVWVGFIKANVDVSISEAERRMRFSQELSKLLKDFPPS